MNIGIIVLLLLTVGVLIYIHTRTIDTFTFEVTPGKDCSLGAYTWQGNSEEAEECRRLNKEDPNQISRFTCGNGFVGVPSHFEYVSAISQE